MQIFLLTSKSQIFKKTIYAKNISDLSSSLSFCSKEKKGLIVVTRILD